MGLILHDPFVGKDGALLTANFSDTWSNYTTDSANSPQVLGNMLAGGAGGGGYYGSVADAGGVVEVCFPLKEFDASGDIGVEIRGVAAAGGNRYLVRYRAVSAQFQVYRNVGAGYVQTNIANANLNYANFTNQAIDVCIRLLTNGAQVEIAIYVERALLGTAIDTDASRITAAGRIGLRAGQADTTTTGVHMGEVAAVDGFTTANLLVCNGDSLTVGQGSSGGHDYPTVLLANLGGTYSMVNNAVTGQGIVDLIPKPWLDYAYRWPGRTNYALIWAGTNDLYRSADPTITYNRYAAYCNNLKGLGFNVIAFTILPRQNAGVPGGFEGWRTTFNNLLKDKSTGWWNFAYNLADVAAQTNLQDPTNVTYYNADKVHLTDAGYAIVATTAQNAITGSPPARPGGGGGGAFVGVKI